MMSCPISVQTFFQGWFEHLLASDAWKAVAKQESHFDAESCTTSFKALINHEHCITVFPPKQNQSVAKEVQQASSSLPG